MNKLLRISDLRLQTFDFGFLRRPLRNHNPLAQKDQTGVKTSRFLCSGLWNSRRRGCAPAEACPDSRNPAGLVEVCPTASSRFARSRRSRYAGMRSGLNSASPADARKLAVEQPVVLLDRRIYRRAIVSGFGKSGLAKSGSSYRDRSARRPRPIGRRVRDREGGRYDRSH